jgi:hypothetical protein
MGSLPKKVYLCSVSGFLSAYGLQSTTHGPLALGRIPRVNLIRHNTNNSQPNSGKDILPGEKMTK